MLIIIGILWLAEKRRGFESCELTGLFAWEGWSSVGSIALFKVELARAFLWNGPQTGNQKPKKRIPSRCRDSTVSVGYRRRSGNGNRAYLRNQACTAGKYGGRQDS